MAQMELVQYNNPGNVEIINEIRGELGGDFANRVPAATKANLNDSLNAMWQYQPALNQFVEALFNKLGTQIIRSLSWGNPLKPFKVGILGMGESIEEVAIGLVKAKNYRADAEALEKELFGRHPSNVQTAYHKVNREEYYPLTINETMLERAFLNEGGLSKMLIELMTSLATSDEWDEYLQTTNTIKRFHDANGFFTLNVPDISNPSSTEADAKQFARVVRGMADTGTFISTKYNARHMERKWDKSELVLITTPDAKAAFDVNALAAAFNPGKLDLEERTISLPAEHIGIPGFQGLLTTRDWLIVADKFLRMTMQPNAVGLYTNWFNHHQEVISASPFENAVLLSSTELTPITVINYNITGLTSYTLTDITPNADDVDLDAPVTVTSGAATVQRGHVYLVQITANTQPTGGPNNGVTLSVDGNKSRRTRVNQNGILVIGFDEKSASVTVHGKATADNTFESDLNLTVTGSLVQGSVGLSIDDDPTTIANTRKPGISPQGGPVGTVLATNNGSWDTSDLTFAYQWTRDGSNISGATADTYTTVTADGGHTIAVVVTASKSGLTGSSATANGVSVTTS